MVTMFYIFVSEFFVDDMCIHMDNNIHVFPEKQKILHIY